MAVQVAMSGARKAAILLLTLGEDPSSEVCKHLREEEIEAIIKELTTLGTVPAETGDRILDRAKGAEASKRILDRLTTKVRTTAGFLSLERADPQQLSKFILAEHPQTIALILAHLNAANAAQLVSLLPYTLRADVLTRMASLDEISPEIIQQ